MIAAADESRALGAVPDKCEIGGEIVLHIMQLTDGGIITTTSEIVHRFPDRDVDYAHALRALWGQG